MGLLYHFEKTCSRLRHSAALKGMMPLWNAVRPVYNRLIETTGTRGLVRHVNGTDTLLLAPECRGFGEVYEPAVWQRVMEVAKPGARIIDVGAHMGLYATAFGLRVGKTGRVLAAEPDPGNLALLRRHVALNQLENIVTILPAALSDQRGTAALAMAQLQSHLAETGAENTVTIDVETLDAVTGDQSWDLLLVDVEGYEEKVLRGGRKLLADTARRPRMIMIEVHPYAWAQAGSTSDSLLGELRQHGYRVRTLRGDEIALVTDYGHIVATVE